MVSIRSLTAADYEAAARIFFAAVHEGTRNLYTPEQRRAWGGEAVNLDTWRSVFLEVEGCFAEDEGGPLGFMTLDQAGYIDFAFVHPDAARKGIGAALFAEVERRARAQAIAELTTNASLAAQPFFARHGFEIVEKEEIARNGATLTRYAMRKTL